MNNMNKNDFVTKNQIKEQFINYNGSLSDDFHGTSNYTFNDHFITGNDAKELYDKALLEKNTSSNDQRFVKASDIEIFKVSEFLNVNGFYTNINDLIPGGSGAVIYQSGAPTIKINYV